MQIDVSQLVNVGAIGVVLAWFMLRAEKKLDEAANETRITGDRVTDAINRLAMAHSLEVLSRPNVPTAIREQASQIVQEIKQSSGAPLFTGVRPPDAT